MALIHWWPTIGIRHHQTSLLVNVCGYDCFYNTSLSPLFPLSAFESNVSSQGVLRFYSDSLARAVQHLYPEVEIKSSSFPSMSYTPYFTWFGLVWFGLVWFGLVCLALPLIIYLCIFVKRSRGGSAVTGSSSLYSLLSSTASILTLSAIGALHLWICLTLSRCVPCCHPVCCRPVCLLY